MNVYNNISGNNNNLGNINGSNNNFGNNSNVTVNSYNNGNQEELLNLMSQLIELFKVEDLSQDDKDSAIDSIEVITEQVTAKEPKKARIKNAWNNIISITTKLPTFLAGASKLKNNIEQSIPHIESIIGEELPQITDLISNITK